MPRINYKHFIGLAALLIIWSSKSLAHEYWIEPLEFQVAPGEFIEADLRNGQNFKGNSLYYLSGRFTKFEVHDGDIAHKAEGTNGDQPALKFKAQKPGLHILTYQSTFDRISFEKWEKFVTYANNQGLDTVVERHIARGLEKKNFNESYARTIKALVSVGDGRGSDRRTGLPFEFVAQDNPYTMAIDNDTHLTVRLFLDEKWLADKQVLIFRNNGEITKTKIRTDALGYAKIPLEGGGKFMLSSVHMFEGDDDPATKRDEWISYWANLVFALPGADALLKKAKDARQKD